MQLGQQVRQDLLALLDQLVQQDLPDHKGLLALLAQQVHRVLKAHKVYKVCKARLVRLVQPGHRELQDLKEALAQPDPKVLRV